MPTIRSQRDMNRDSLRYLISNTDISYVADGSISKALLEATNLEISRLQDFVVSTIDNAFLSTANGIYLDFFGETLGVPRLRDRKASVAVLDKIIRFYVDSGTLGSRLQSPVDPSIGVIPAGTTITNAAGTIVYTVTTPTIFPVSARTAYVSAVAETVGANYNIGANQLNVHSLGNSDIKVTNDISISTGSDIEPDNEYRFRLSKTMTARFGSNESAVKLASISQPGVSRAELLQFARGAGTFDVLLVPQGNRLSKSVIDNTRRAVEQVVAYGISPRIKEPEYVSFKIAVQLSYKDGTLEGQKINARSAAESSVLRYLASIPLGGEIIINQIRAAIIDSDSSIKDLQILELCIDGQSRVIRNIKLHKDELVIPCEDCPDPIEII